MNERDLSHVFDRFGVNDIALRSEVREFASMDTQSQLVWLFLAVQQSSKSGLSKRSIATATTLGVAIMAAATYFIEHSGAFVKFGGG